MQSPALGKKGTLMTVQDGDWLAGKPHFWKRLRLNNILKESGMCPSSKEDQIHHGKNYQNWPVDQRMSLFPSSTCEIALDWWFFLWATHSRKDISILEGVQEESTNTRSWSTWNIRRWRNLVCSTSPRESWKGNLITIFESLRKECEEERVKLFSECHSRGMRGNRCRLEHGKFSVKQKIRGVSLTAIKNHAAFPADNVEYPSFGHTQNLTR